MGGGAWQIKFKQSKPAQIRRIQELDEIVADHGWRGVVFLLGPGDPARGLSYGRVRHMDGIANKGQSSEASCDWIRYPRKCKRGGLSLGNAEACRKKRGEGGESSTLCEERLGEHMVFGQSGGGGT